MKQLPFIAGMLLLSTIVFAQQPADKIIGKWESVDSLKAKLKNADELNFRGYLGIPLLGKTMKFKRIK